MLWIDNQLVPDNIKIGDLRILQKKIDKSKTAAERARVVKRFAVEHKLTSQEAIATAKMVQVFREVSP